MFGIENESGTEFPKGFSLLDGKILARPLTIPVVIDPARPKGFPIAITVSPTLISEEFPIDSGTSILRGTVLKF